MKKFLSSIFMKFCSRNNFAKPDWLTPSPYVVQMIVKKDKKKVTSHGPVGIQSGPLLAYSDI